MTRRRRLGALTAILATFLVAIAGASSSADAAAYQYCGVLKSGGSYCPLTSQLPQRHSYVSNGADSGTSACTTWQSLAYTAYESSNGSSPKYDQYNPTCKNSAYFILGNNTSLVRLYMRHNYGSPQYLYGQGVY